VQRMRVSDIHSSEVGRRKKKEERSRYIARERERERERERKKEREREKENDREESGDRSNNEGGTAHLNRRQDGGGAPETTEACTQSGWKKGLLVEISAYACRTRAVLLYSLLMLFSNSLLRTGRASKMFFTTTVVPELPRGAGVLLRTSPFLL